MPLMEVVLEQRFANQQSINRWNYMASGTPAAVTLSFALLSSMGFLAVSNDFADDTIAGAIQNAQNVLVHFIQATARAVYLDEDFYGNAFLAATDGHVGTATTALSPINAFGFRSNRVRQSINRGYKRFVGVDEGALEAGGVLTIAARTQMDGLAAIMSETLTYDDEGNTLTFTPCIVSKEKYTTPSGREAYRYYSSEIVQDTHLAQGIQWEAYNESRSQVSRQYGRGS